MTIVAAIGDTSRDGAVVREARELAERLGEELYVVIVMKSSDFVELERASIERTGQVVDRDELESMAEQVASEIAAEAIADEYAYEVAAFIGEPVEELTTFAEAHDVEYLVIGGRKRSPIGKLVFGSTAQSILLNYDRPIVSVKVDREA